MKNSYIRNSQFQKLRRSILDDFREKARNGLNAERIWESRGLYSSSYVDFSDAERAVKLYGIKD